MLARVGFTSVYECYVPAETTKPIHRVTFVAIKGNRPKLKNAPLMATYPTEVRPEFTSFKAEQLLGKFYKMSRLIPERVRVLMKSGGFLGTMFKPFPAAIGRNDHKK